MAMASQCAPSVPPNRSANNGVQRQRRGDDVRDTALLEPSKQPSVTFSVKVLEFLDSKSETDVDVDYNSLYSKQDFLQGEVTEENLAALFINCGQSDDECEMCARTIYCTNIDKKVTQADLKLFFESICGEVGRSLLQTQSPFCTTKSLQKWHHQDRSGDQQDHGLHQV
ncbi:Polyadenylate-binding protein-interacting protein 10 [Zea mays]|uniref:Polyadenylate-binding protein-interacting protein 10 n=1 Tax=Zea mays TaxID=4577 RepID=A0A1D6LXI8_MAIZE|nr:Polyadenylate-binding protein-interacting protein 10 [Zea mays]